MGAKLARGYWFFLFNAVLDLPKALITGREKLWLRFILSGWTYDPQVLTNEDITTYTRAYAQHGGLRGTLEDYRADEEEVRQEQADASVKLTCPTLALWGEDFESAYSQQREIHLRGQAARPAAVRRHVRQPRAADIQPPHDREGADKGAARRDPHRGPAELPDFDHGGVAGRYRAGRIARVALAPERGGMAVLDQGHRPPPQTEAAGRRIAAQRVHARQPTASGEFYDPHPSLRGRHRRLDRHRP